MKKITSLDDLFQRVQGVVSKELASFRSKIFGKGAATRAALIRSCCPRWACGGFGFCCLRRLLASSQPA